MSAVAAFPLRQSNLPPSNVEAEAALLGAALSENAVLDRAAHSLRPADFFEPAHARIFERMLEVRLTGATVTPVTLKPYFDADESLKDLGGSSYLARLTGDGQGLLAPQALVEQIAEMAERRRRREWLSDELAACCDLAQPLTGLMPPEAFGAAGRLQPMDLAALSKLEPVPKAFTVPKIAPAGEVTLFTGPGAVGKSLLAQQICSAIAAGKPTIGLALDRAPAIYVTCEDDRDQLHWRQAHICKALGVEMADLDRMLHLISLRGEPDNAIAHFAPDGRLTPAPLYGRLAQLIKDTGARLVGLDNVAHLFAGNENDRHQVTGFVNLLNRLAGETGTAILLLGHPNKAGASYSGSTAWLNAVRSQVFMARLEGEAADPDQRTLSINKPNYTRAGEGLQFRWHEWAFVLDEEIPAEERAVLDETARTATDNAVFLACLAERTEQRRAVSENRSPTFAPSVFATMPESKGIGRERLEAAMDRLFRLGRVERARLWTGPDRKPVYGLFDTAGNGAGNTLRETQETLV